MYEQEYPEAMKCLATDLEEVLTALRFPESHRRRIRTTNLLERLFAEGRRGSKVVPRFMSERSGLSLLFAVLVDASAGWHGVKVTQASAQQLEALRPQPSAKAFSRPRCLTWRRLGEMGLPNALSFNLRHDEAIVPRTIYMISPDKREEWIIRQARQRPAAERGVFLDGACAGDAALRERLERLLAAQDQPEEVLADGIDAATMKATIKLDLGDAPDEAVGQTIGRYKLLEQIGEGGCGVVYVAEQKEPVRRKVALKVIKLGMDTKQVVARFEAERQALAMMDHPNIAKVLDAGATDTGRPYFVMELVRGIRITDYCNQNQLSTKERIDLFVKVCHAIQHAHQKGIIHRDIKPSNILVTLHDGIPVPKVIDFGIAKATQGELTDKTIHTQFQQFIGTPAYMRDR